MNTHDKYEVEVHAELNDIGTKTEIGSEEHRKAVDDVTKLTDRLIRLKEVDLERDKLEAEQEKIAIEKEKIAIEKQKVEVEQTKINESRKDRVINNIIAGANIIVPAGITVTGMVLMFLFEEKGTITSGAGRKIIDRIFRMK